MDKKWWKESVVYQIYPRSFCDSNDDGMGDLQGICSKLDYLQKLGVDVVWLSPIYQSPNDDNGYDISDYRAIMKDFGTMEDFEQLLSETHKRGMKMMLDLVVNHSSDEHPWFVSARESKESPYHDYYIWQDGEEGKLPNNWGSRFSGSAWQWNEKTKEYYLHVFTKKQVDLNWDNENLRRAIYDMMEFWLGKGIDGFRMDVINAISKDQSFPDTTLNGLYGSIDGVILNGPKVHEYLQEMNREVLSRHDLITVGETVNVTTSDAVQYASSKGNELDMVHNFQHLVLDYGPHGLWSCNRTKLSDLKKVFTKWQKDLEGKAWNSLFLNNHDEARMVSRFGNDSEEYREKSAKMLATCLYFLQGTPYIYQGEELGMTNVHFSDLSQYEDVQMRNAHQEIVVEQKAMTEEEFLHAVWAKGRDNCRTPMQWNAEQNAGFTKGTPWLACNPNYRTINAAAELEDSNSVFSYYQKIIRLRHENPIIVYGSYDIVEEENPSLYCYTRTYEDQKLLVVCNFTEKEVFYQIPKPFAEGEILLTNESDELSRNRNVISPYGARVYYRR